jgi:hypothetical protein
MKKANINNVKIGDKAYIEVEIRNITKEKSSNPIVTNICDFCFTENGLLNPNNPNSHQLYIKEEIPTLGEGVEMMVSQDEICWWKYKVIAKTKSGSFINDAGNWWTYAKPIELTIEEQLASANKRIKELEEQLNSNNLT